MNRIYRSPLAASKHLRGVTMTRPSNYKRLGVCESTPKHNIFSKSLRHSQRRLHSFSANLNFKPSNSASYATFLPDIAFRLQGMNSEQDVESELATLWKPVNDHLMDDPEKALTLCKERLENPAVYLSSLSTTPADQLRVIGYYLLSAILRQLHLEPNAKFPNPSKREDEYMALRQAAEAAIRYSPKEPVLWIFADFIINDYGLAVNSKGRSPDMLQDWKNLNDLHRIVLRRKRVDAQIDGSEATKEGYRKVLMMTKGFLQGLEGSCPKEENELAYQALDEVASALQGYVDIYGLERPLEQHHIELLLSFALRMEQTGATEAQALNVLAFLRKCQGIIMSFRSHDDYDITNYEEYGNIERFYALALIRIAAAIPSYDTIITNGLTPSDLLLEASDIYRGLAHLPKDLNGEIPSDWQLQDAQYYVTILRELAKSQQNFQSRIESLQQALRALFLVAQAQSAIPLPSIPPYSDLISRDAWSSCSIAMSETAISVLDGIMHARTGWGLGIQEGNDPAPEGTFPLAEKEAMLALRLAEGLLTSAQTPEEKTSAEMRKAERNIAVGIMRYYQGDPKDVDLEVVALWKDAKRVLGGLETTGEAEANRNSYLKTVEELLQVAEDGQKSIRHQKIWKECNDFWQPVYNLVVQEKHQEAVTAIRERLADPMSYFSDPPLSTVEELQTEGYHQLGLSLYYAKDDVTDPEYAQEILDTLKTAEESFRLYFPEQETAMAQNLRYQGRMLSHIGRFSESISVYRTMLKKVEDMDSAWEAKEEPDKDDKIELDKAGKIELITALRYYCRELAQSGDDVSSLQPVQDAWTIVQDYFARYGSDSRWLCARADTLGDLACGYFMAGKVEEAISTAIQAVDVHEELIEEVRKSDDWSDDNLTWLEDGRLCALSNALIWSRQTDRTTLYGKALPELRREVSEMFRRNAGLPADLREGFSPDYKLDWVYAIKYSDSIRTVSDDATSESERIAALEKSMEVLALAVNVAENDPQPIVFIPYSEALTKFDWRSINQLLAESALGILQRIAKSRLGRLQENLAASPEDEGVLLSREIEVAMALAENEALRATTPKVTFSTLQQKVEWLIGKGEALKARGIDGYRGVWLEAKELVGQLNASDEADGKEKEELLEKLEELLRSEIM